MLGVARIALALALFAPQVAWAEAGTSGQDDATAAREALAKDLAAFKSTAKSYQETVTGLVKRAYQSRRDKLLASYDEDIRKEEAEERVRRVAAITLFEDFLRRYPNDDRWSPDVIFRLAELYFEKSNDEYLQATEAYEQALSALDNEGSGAAPVPPHQNYQPTIELHRRLIREFPKYRLIDGAYYLMGFCLQEMGELEKGNQAFLSLVCRNRYKPPLEDKDVPEGGERLTLASEGGIGGSSGFNTGVYDGCDALIPDSRFNPESWIRVGEYHFDENSLGPAIAAYRKVLEPGPKDNPYYDEALYKLAWTYYRADRYPQSIKNFDNLVAYSDKEFEATGKYGSEMRPESIQYLAISFAEPDWDGDTLPDDEPGMARIEAFYKDRTDEKHVYEVYRRLGDIYFDTTKYSDAVSVYKLVLNRWPYRSDNPDVQDRIITALERDRQFEAAIKEREEFTRRFGKGTEWEKQNINNAEALRKAREYDEQALMQAAVYHHRQGQERKKRGLAMADGLLLQQAAREYAYAAQAYEKYLERFPNTKNSYEIRYSYASCLYYSQRFLEAAQAFSLVRDSNLDNRYQEEAAFSATKAYEEYIATQVREKKLPDPSLPDPQNAPEAVAALAIPEAYANWQVALDRYAQVLPKSPKTPRLTYKSAEISYRFLNFEDSRQRMASIYTQYCEDPIAIKAGKAMLVSYQLEKNLDKMEEWATNLRSGKCGAEVEGAKQIIEGIKFKRANALMSKAEKSLEAGQKQQAFSYFDQAAAAYLALVDASPQSGDADKALNNAAVAYEKSQRFESATTIYERLWQQYPKSQFADEALWRSAINHRKYFAFDKAVQSFLILADSPRFANSKRRTDAVYNAAVILENDQAYGRAAQLFLRYASTVSDPKEAAEAYFQAGEIYEKMNDYGQTVKVLGSFAAKHGSAPDQGRHTVEAAFIIGRMAQKRGDWRSAKRYYQQAIREFKTRGLTAGSDAAEFAAHAEFKIVEKEVAAFLKTKIKGGISKLPGLQKRMAAQAKALKAKLEGVWQYKRALWTLGAMFMSGTVYEHFARTMAAGYREAPVPKKVRRLGQDAIDIYMSQLDEALDREVRPIEDAAQKLYVACVERAKQFGVSNSYTEDARRRLYAFDPVTYPLLKAPKIEVVID